MRRWAWLAFAVLAACGPAGGDGAAPPRPNLLLVVIDTLRFDRLGVYGYEHPTSPRIDALAARGRVYDRHVSQGAQTVPATLSLLLSQLPAEHGFVHRYDGQFAEEPPRYPGRLSFLGEVLREAGYRTGGFVGNPFLGARNGFDQGFDRFVHAVSDDRRLADAAKEFAAEASDAPFFLYLHLFEVHWPYQPPPEYRALFSAPPLGKLVYRNGPVEEVPAEDLAFTEAAYDAGVRYADALVGELLDALEAAGVADRSVVAITSDHGDEFLEHGGMGHGTHVFGELVRAPLVLFDPRAPAGGERVAHLTRGVDVAPTLLDLAGVPRPPSFRGGSLLEPAGQAFSEEGAWRTVYADGFKLIRQLEAGEESLYAAADALDLRPLEGHAERRSALAAQLDAYLALEEESARWRAGWEKETAPAWSAEELERLRALGYAR